ncbi:MAG: hypothetical protein JKY88_03185 [Pseudomonadales bacterium]|nr:hypothetical protein [Pseudomonadales bacterium]
MTINIDDFTETELMALNHQIVERLKFLDSVNAHHEMMQFSLGDQVSFDPLGREKQLAILVKFNKKTVTVLTADGQKWNVPPHLLSKVKAVVGNEDNVIGIHRNK